MIIYSFPSEAFTGWQRGECCTIKYKQRDRSRPSNAQNTPNPSQRVGRCLRIVRTQMTRATPNVQSNAKVGHHRAFTATTEYDQQIIMSTSYAHQCSFLLTLTPRAKTGCLLPHACDPAAFLLPSVTKGSKHNNNNQFYTLRLFVFFSTVTESRMT